MSDLDTVRAEVQAWLAEHWDPDRSLLEWRSLLVDSGWGCPSWPTDRFGRGLRADQGKVVAEEFQRVGAVSVASGVGMGLVAPTLLAHGTDDQLARLLRPIVTGEHRWCQLFSEPGAGSDLAGLTTRADRDGEEWIVSGQKVWNSGAHRAAFGILLARTDWEVPKHKGISYFAIAMDQSGIEVRPLKQSNGHASFNEVFFSEARVEARNLIGNTGDGWRIALTTLTHERAAALNTGRRPRVRTEAGRCVVEANAESAEYYKTYEWYPQRAGRTDLAQPRARETGQAADPVVRQELMVLHAQVETTKWSNGRVASARATGRSAGPEGSLSKLNGSRIARLANGVHTTIAGASGMLSGSDAPLNGVITEILLSTPAMSIAGGTDEIQHNIIGERVLGLPKEPGSDADLPFREVRTNLRG